MARVRDFGTEKNSGTLSRTDYFGGDPQTGATFKATLGAIQDFIVAGTGAGNLYVPLFFFGDLIVGQIFDGWTAPFNCNVIGVEISAQKAPTGGPAGFDLVDGAGASYSKAAALAATVKYQRTIFGSALALNEGDFVAGKVTAKGITVAGGYVLVKLIVQPRLT